MIRLITHDADAACPDGQTVLTISNDADPRDLALDGVDRIELHFPKFTDGRAYSQAYLLRRRLGFKGELRATGDVQADQLLQMQRSGFDAAVLRTGADLACAQRQLAHFAAFYQGDANVQAPWLNRQHPPHNAGSDAALQPTPHARSEATP